MPVVDPETRGPIHEQIGGLRRDESGEWAERSRVDGRRRRDDPLPAEPVTRGPGIPRPFSIAGFGDEGVARRRAIGYWRVPRSLGRHCGCRSGHLPALQQRSRQVRLDDEGHDVDTRVRALRDRGTSRSVEFRARTVGWGGDGTSVNKKGRHLLGGTGAASVARRLGGIATRHMPEVFIQAHGKSTTPRRERKSQCPHFGGHAGFLRGCARRQVGAAHPPDLSVSWQPRP